MMQQCGFYDTKKNGLGVPRIMVVAVAVFLCLAPGLVFAWCGDGCTDDACCHASCGPTCYLDTQGSQDCVCPCDPGLKDCPANSYNKENGQTANEVCYECESCSNVYKDGISFPFSAGGQVTIDKCYARENCSNLNHSDWMCTLFYSGENFCTQGNTLKSAHLEYQGNTLVCVLNTKDCSDFDLSSGGNLEQLLVDYAGTQGIAGWNKNLQQGTAVWDTSNYKWDVEHNCQLLQSVTKIKRGNLTTNCNGYIFRMGAGTVGSSLTGFSIKYTGEDTYFCSNCDGGKTPEILPWSGNNYYGCSFWNIGSGGNGNYKVCACSAVESGFYSDGCDWQYPLNSDNIPDNCHMQCRANMTTLDPGADSINSCVPYGGTYCDQTGCFTLGTNADLCE